MPLPLSPSAAATQLRELRHAIRCATIVPRGTVASIAAMRAATTASIGCGGREAVAGAVTCSTA